MKTQQHSTLLKTHLTVLLFLTLLYGMATSATATPYTILIENPGVWSIAGSFDSNTDTWNATDDIMNWSFTANVFGSPSFTVGPLSQAGGDNLSVFRGSTDPTESLCCIIFLESSSSNQSIEVDTLLPVVNDYEVRICCEPLSQMEFLESGKSSDLTIRAAAVPEPATALLLITGLAGLAGYRWHYARRERMQAREPAFYPSHVGRRQVRGILHSSLYQGG